MATGFICKDMSLKFALILMAYLAFAGCDTVRERYRAYKQSRMVEVACVSLVPTDDATLNLLVAKLNRWPVKVEMESTLGIMSIYVDRADVTLARELIEQDDELQKRGVKLHDY